MIVFSQGIKIKMFNKNKIQSESGQTIIEYILMSLLVSGIMIGVWRSNFFQDLLGPSGRVTNSLTSMMRFSYRHAITGKKKEVYSDSDYESPAHLSYKDQEGSRFFGPAEGYPR